MHANNAEHDRLLTVMTGKRHFFFKHAVAWVRHDFGKSKQSRLLDTVNASQIVFPKCSSNQLDVAHFNSYEDIEGHGCYFQWDFYYLEKTEIEDPD